MPLTITIPGAVVATTGATAPATLTVGVGAPGATGPQGPAGPGVPAGGTAGQYLQKIDGTNYNTDWVTLNLSGYAVKANNLSDLTSASTARTNLGLGTMATATASDYSTTSVANGLYYPLTGNPSSFLTASALTGYATQSWVSAGFAPLARAVPSAGTTGQVLTKNSGTDYDASWATFIPGDRYLTTSSTSLTIGNGTKSLTVGTGLSYTTQQDIVIAYDASNHMHALVTSYNSGTGVLVADVQHHTGSGTYTAWTVNVGGTTPLQSVEWGEILGVIGDQGDLSTALSSKLESATAATTYAALAGATFTGEVITPASTTSNAGLTITPGTAPTSPTNGEIWATTSDLQIRLNGVTETIAEQSWVTSQGYLTSTDLTPYALKAGATFTGLVTTVASTTTTAGLNVPHGAAPTTPVNGDVWSTTGGLFWRQNGSTKQAMNLGDTQTVSGNVTFSNANNTFGSSTAAGTINVGTGATISGSTKAINIGTAGVSGSTTNVTVGSSVAGAGVSVTVNGSLTTTGASQNIGNSTAASTINIGSGATISGSTKAINLGANGVAGSTTAITIGSTTGSSSTTLQGSTVGVTLAADTNTTGLATTAFVVGQAGSATPLVNGTAAVGTSLRYARQDHVHPTDTTRAPLASPTFTGTPAAPTATAGTNTTQIATTAFVQQEVPAASTTAAGKVELATFVEATRFTSQSLATTPLSLMGLIAANGGPIRPRSTAFTAASSGAGASAQNYFGASICYGPNASTVGYGGTYFDAAGYWASANAYTTPDWSKVTGFSVMVYRPSIAFESGNTIRITLGKAASGGTLTTRGIGLDIAAGNTFAQILAHNGTTLTTTNSTFPVSSYANISSRNITMVSYGNGTVELFVDGVSYGTSTGGPTTAGGTGTRYSEEVYGSGTQTGQMQLWTFNASVFTGL